MVDLDLIRATRTPWMNSRISAVEADWFIERAESAPWSLGPVGAELVAADPLTAGGLYDRAEKLYDHFFGARPRGVNVAKVSKVLHLMRPKLYPVLDERLTQLYRGPATQAAALLSQDRPALGSNKRLYWAAIRRDIVDNASALHELREVLRDSDVQHAAAVADEVGDVRLLDMMAWAASG